MHASIHSTLTSTGCQKQVGSRPVSHMIITLSLSAEAMEQSDVLGYQPPLPLNLVESAPLHRNTRQVCEAGSSDIETWHSFSSAPLSQTRGTGKEGKGGAGSVGAGDIVKIKGKRKERLNNSINPGESASPTPVA